MLFLSFIWPRTNSSVFVVDKTSGTGDSVVFAVNTVIEFITDMTVFMGEVSVLPGAVLTWFRGLSFRPLGTIDVEWQVTLLDGWVVVVEDHAVRAELFRYHTVGAYVILVALVSVGEVPVRFRALVCEGARRCLLRRRRRSRRSRSSVR